MKKQTAMWVTKSGERLRICDMDDSHLINSIKFLHREASKHLASEISAAYSSLCFLQGEMATFFCEQDINSMENTTPEEFLDYCCPIYNKLVLEAERRKLKYELPKDRMGR